MRCRIQSRFLSVYELCPPHVFDALDAPVHADGISNRELRTLDKKLNGTRRSLKRTFRVFRRVPPQPLHVTRGVLHGSEFRHLPGGVLHHRDDGRPAAAAARAQLLAGDEPRADPPQPAAGARGPALQAGRRGQLQSRAGRLAVRGVLVPRLELRNPPPPLPEGLG